MTLTVALPVSSSAKYLFPATSTKIMPVAPSMFTSTVAVSFSPTLLPVAVIVGVTLETIRFPVFSAGM